MSRIPSASIASPLRIRTIARTKLILLCLLYGPTLSAQTGSGPGVAQVAPGSVTGQVINALSGLPIARALVRLNDRAILTDHDGNFRFDQNTETTANLTLTKPGFYSTADPGDASSIFLQASQLAAPLHLLLYPEALLTGTVRTQDNQPLPRIMVIPRRSSYDETGRHLNPSAQAQTDAHGRFRLTVPAGSYRIETRYVAHQPPGGLALLPEVYPRDSSSGTFALLAIRSGQEQHIELTVAAEPTHVVTIATGSTQDLPGSVRVSAVLHNGAVLQVSPLPAEIPGQLKLELPQGTYTLRAGRGGQDGVEQAEAVITVPDHDISGVNLRFARTPSIPVELLVDNASTSDNNHPALQQLDLGLQDIQSSGIDSGAIRLTAAGNNVFAFLVPAGSYRLQERGIGEWYVKAASYGGSDVLQNGLVVAPGSAGTPIRVTVSNQTGSLQGSVRRKGSLTPCWIYLIPSGPAAQSVLSFRSNAEGVYTYAHLPPGGYQAIAFEQRHSVDYRDPAVLAGFSSHLQAVTINAGDKATLDLDAVPSTELLP